MTSIKIHSFLRVRAQGQARLRDKERFAKPEVIQETGFDEVSRISIAAHLGQLRRPRDRSEVTCVRCRRIIKGRPFAVRSEYEPELYRRNTLYEH